MPELPETRLTELLELAERAAATAMTDEYEPVGATLREADADLEPAIRQLLAAGRIGDAMTLVTGLHSSWIDAGRVADGQRLAETALGAADGVDGIDPVFRGRTMLTVSEAAFRVSRSPSRST